jgi:hypothetical protein
MARCSALHTVALCTTQNRLPLQQPSGAGEWQVEARAFQLNLCQCQHETCAHLRLPSVCFAERASFRKTTTTLVTSCTPWAQSWPKPNACKECVPGTQLKYRVCLTAVSLSLRQFFRDYTSQWTRCQWYHLLAAISGIELRRNYSFRSVSANAAQIYVSQDKSEANVPSEEISVAPPFHQFPTDNYSVSDGDSQVT